ncbi:HNH endonuclease signature motif containing protein [Aliarcobacter butzleri]|uniref:HNH endonuclease signature motif containing protein n=1 Tax=Aliarcobacter butzleri TaxID=28197 RepID=A0AAP4Q0F8_9BACT|nr:HNH endonuclease signature motif containing protein [Aliarcobacter butzleri]MDN5053058.1 HNH endonuclease signature motif containing protein [Aliarcobacter butzleri]MDN5076091.1 HNH endonuclease signature motif containing protein [Aliarcobacter butzleri]MDN5117476.1 HNH endonuclease signature motif containing protein [Aliarcobacter butzleri]MDN5133284.1 HNH endonuclease signature motif containing protein [Aliarcobacter butzleri]
MAFSNETFSDESYGIASSTADRINGTFIQKTQGENGCDIIDIEDALVFDERLIYVTYKPSKKTLLHYYMKNYFIAEFNYLRRKTDLSFPEYIFPLLNELKVKYNNNTTNSYEEYNYYLYNLLINNCDKYINEAFNILFEDRNLMKNFSISVSKLIQKIKKQQYPKFLADDGKIKRYSNWNKWLQEALFYREKGRCANCGCDLSGTIAINNKINIDHIIPLTKGGTNDPTNLQILCSTCNKKKYNSSSEAGNNKHIFW